LNHIPTLRPLTIFYPTDNILIRNDFEIFHSRYEDKRFDALVYPKGFNLEDESIRVCIIFHDTEGGDETIVLVTDMNPHTEKTIPSDDDCLRLYTNRKDAYNYVQRISNVILKSVSQ
jgi:hypothetical protein